MSDGPLAEPGRRDPAPAVGHAAVPESAKLPPGVPPPDPPDPAAPAAAQAEPAAPHRGVAPVRGGVVNPPTTGYGSGGDRAAPPPAPGPAAAPTAAAGPAPAHPEENTGSLTGFILSRGRTDGPGSRTRLLVIALVMLAMLAVLVLVGLFAIRALIDAALG